MDPARADLARDLALAKLKQRLFNRDVAVKIGRYHLLELVVEGGMGVVWGAWDPELDRRVAIKLVGALQYDHIPATDGSGNSLGVEISDLTRNINIQSEDPYHTMARGHTMFMHNANVNIAGAK